MVDTDMILWTANGLNSSTLDLWSTGNITPTIDPN